VAGADGGSLRVYDPEAGSTLHTLDCEVGFGAVLACIASSSAAPHHPRVVAASRRTVANVWDAETGELLADLEGHGDYVTSVAVWKEHEGGHDRIATAGLVGGQVWDGETFTILYHIACAPIQRVMPYRAAEGPHRLLVALADDQGLQVWDPEEGRLLHHGINRGCPTGSGFHLFESAQGRHLLAFVGRGNRHARHPGDTLRSFLDVWDLGEAPAATGHLRPAHHLG
jgi:WD40 repeat protein